MNPKRALLTGITGQDGSYLARLLLDKDYEVPGGVGRTITFNTDRIEDIYRDPHEQESRMFLHCGDLTDGTSLCRILEKREPHEVYSTSAKTV